MKVFIVAMIFVLLAPAAPARSASAVANLYVRTQDAFNGSAFPAVQATVCFVQPGTVAACHHTDEFGWTTEVMQPGEVQFQVTPDDAAYTCLGGCVRRATVATGGNIRFVDLRILPWRQYAPGVSR